MNRLDEFREVRAASFEFVRPPGEPPTPMRLICKELRTGRLLCLGQPELARSPAPYTHGEDILFVAYDAAAALGCHLSLGWPIPTNILDLYAEFRWLNSGLLPPGDYSLADALHHYGLQGCAESLATL